MNQDRPLVWTLHHGQRFTLTSENGVEIRLPYRKVEELFVAILRGGQAGVLRTDLEKEFWPESPLESRQTNLRQLLSQLRKAVGIENIFVDRIRCAIDSRLTVRCFPTLKPLESVARSKATPVEGFFRFVESMAATDPARMIETMKINLDLADSMTPLQKSTILQQFGNAFSPSDTDFKWILFWNGSVALQTKGIRPAKYLFKESVKRGMATGDDLLVGIASYSWALCEILLGEPGKAIEIAHRTSAFSKGASASQMLRQKIIEPVAMIHLGRTKEGMDGLDGFDHSYFKSEGEFLSYEALSSLFEATNGNYEGALTRLQAPLNNAIKTGDLGLKTICELTKLFVLSRTVPHEAVAPLIDLIAECKAAKLGHVELYAREALASTYRAVGEDSLAEKSFLQAKDARIALGFKVTDWDRARLVAV